MCAFVAALWLVGYGCLAVEQTGQEHTVVACLPYMCGRQLFVSVGQDRNSGWTVGWIPKAHLLLPPLLFYQLEDRLVLTSHSN